MYDISPIKTRSKTATAPSQRLFESRSEVIGDPKTPENQPSSVDSPLAGRGIGQQSQSRLSPSPQSHSSKSHSSDHEHQSLSSCLIAHRRAALTLYPQTEDEQIVNLALILFLNSIAAHCTHAKADWTPVRKISQTQLRNASFEARTNGFLRGPDNSVEAIVEVRPRVRSIRTLAIQIQEAAQMVSWIISDGLRAPNMSYYVLISQNRHQIFLTVADYSTEYVKYLKDEYDEQTPRSFLKMRSFGLWEIYSPSHMDHLARILLAYTIKVSEKTAGDASENA
ncbi:hypothetical protein AJ79_02987 [Helicocarpus griseus UAMH5409]|uniref:Uncharacterized protein n=1 Tax=Helicocarpus griseus UAMH5409 TaxID=1447875 RepID=A0A2B7XRU9_9EURO|nr:hypothetical protein AJ79_02987 [Helicocarpus griseus UAMH5409]